jgi:hypothetical protein
VFETDFYSQAEGVTESVRLSCKWRYGFGQMQCYKEGDDWSLSQRLLEWRQQGAVTGATFNGENAEFGIVYIFIGAEALKVDHGAKCPEEAPFIERFQRSGPSASKASGVISQKRSLKGFRQTWIIL